MKKAVINLLLLLAPCSPLLAGGESAVDILKNDLSPRAAGMGGAFTAVSNDIYSIYYNPAGLGALVNPEATIYYGTGFEQYKAQYIAFGSPLPIPGFSGLGKGYMAGSFQTTDLGTFNYRWINPDGSIYSKNYNAEKNSIFSLAYSEKVSQQNLNLDFYKAYVESYLGIGVKYVKSTILENYSGSAFAVDAGYKAVEPNIGLSFGVSLMNSFGQIKYLEEKYPLPALFRVGLAYKRPTVLDQQLTTSLEYERFLKDSESAIRAGFEYHLEKILNFRLGYVSMPDNKGLSFGVGVFNDNFSIDMASSVLTLYTSTSFSLSYRFNYTLEGYKAPAKAFKEPKPKPKKEAPKENKPSQGQKNDNFFWIY